MKHFALLAVLGITAAAQETTAAMAQRIASLEVAAAEKAIDEGPQSSMKDLATEMTKFANDADRRGDVPTTLRLDLLVVRAAERSGDTGVLGKYLVNLAQAYNRLGDAVRSVDVARRAISLLSPTGMPELASANIVLCRSLGDLGEEQESMAACRQAIESAQQAAERTEEARARNQLATTFLHFDRNREALEEFMKSLALAEETGQKLGAAFVKNNIGNVFDSQGNYPLALRYYQESLAAKREVGTLADQITSLGNIALVYVRTNRVPEAEEAFRNVLAACDQLKSATCRGTNLFNLGVLQLKNGKAAEAEANIREALKTADVVTAVGMRISLAEALATRGLYGEARALLEASQRDGEDLRISNTIWRAYHDLGNLERVDRKLESAEQWYRKALERVENLRENVAGGQSQVERFFETMALPFQSLMDVQVTQGKSVEALATSERYKARTLLDLLGSNGDAVAKGMSREETRQERDLKTGIARTNAALMRELARPQRNDQRIAQARAALESLQADIDAFEIQLYQKHPNLRSQRNQQPLPDPQQVMAKLPANAVALEFAYGSGEYVGFIVTSKTVQHFEVAVPRAQLSVKIETLAKSLAGRDLAFHSQSKELYGLLIEPAAQALKGKKTLIVIPDASLWQLPFAALEDRQGHYLTEQISVSYAPSLSVLAALTKRAEARATSSSLYALGNPAMPAGAMDQAAIPQTEVEVKSIGGLFDVSRRVVRTGAEATESSFKAQAGDKAFLHLATHGILNSVSPLDSEILLAADANEDGHLSAREIMQLNLNADLVVLSACEMANGRVGAGEGLIGMSWALFVAGAPATVANLWKTDANASASMMVDLHRQLKAGLSKSDALRQAMLATMKKPEFRHPFYWAGFELIGNPF